HLSGATMAESRGRRPCPNQIIVTRKSASGVGRNRTTVRSRRRRRPNPRPGNVPGTCPSRTRASWKPQRDTAINCPHHLNACTVRYVGDPLLLSKPDTICCERHLPQRRCARWVVDLHLPNGQPCSSGEP